MLIIEAKQIDWEKRGGTWHGVAEASSLGLRPGAWPVVVVVEGKSGNRLFTDETIPHPDCVRRADEIGHRYNDSRGCYLRILND